MRSSRLKKIMDPAIFDPKPLGWKILFEPRLRPRTESFFTLRVHDNCQNIAIRLNASFEPAENFFHSFIKSIQPFRPVQCNRKYLISNIDL
jgi:hypothetical protein